MDFDPMEYPQHVVIDGSRLEGGFPGLPGVAELGPCEAVLYGDAARFDDAYAGAVAVAVAGGNWTVLDPEQLRRAVIVAGE